MAELLQNRALIVDDFRRARRNAALQEIFAQLTGKSAELLSYDDVRRKLKGQEVPGRKLQTIPLANIVGSVGRYKDFTHRFLPRDDSQMQRWTNIKMGAAGFSGLPPIEVYGINDTYFVIDGNHRVSVSREMGLSTIEAYVTTVKTKVPISPDDQPDDLVIKAEYAQFLEQTHIDRLHPDAELRLTVPDQYRLLLEHIDVHRYYMGLVNSRPVPYPDAVSHWYETVYRPVKDLINERGIMLDFPERTETDLYLWISKHRAELEQLAGWDITPNTAAQDLVVRHGTRKRSAETVSPARSRLQQVLAPGRSRASPVEQQGDQQQRQRREDRIVNDILVAINGDETGWLAMKQAMVVARREKAQLIGVHVAAGGNRADSTESIAGEFARRCAEQDIPGKFATATGNVNDCLCQYTRLVDLVVLNMKQHARSGDAPHVTKSFHELIHSCSGPVLAVIGKASSLERTLLAYDGSPRSEQALYIASYLAGWWKSSLVVVTVDDNENNARQIQQKARRYLDSHKLKAVYVTTKGDAAAAILHTAEQHHRDSTLMGGTGKARMLRFMLGSVVDEVLGNSRNPVLVCR